MNGYAPFFRPFSGCFKPVFTPNWVDNHRCEVGGHAPLYPLSLGYELPRHVHELLLRTGNIEHAHLPLEEIMHHEDTLLSGEVFAEYHPVIAAPRALADDARFTPVKGEERDAV